MLPTEKLVGKEEERAVSPVIGVILMVAITVILAAVIAAFVLDIGDTGEPVQANLDLSETSDHDIDITITNVDAVDDIQLRGCEEGDIGLVDATNAENDLGEDAAELSVGSTGQVPNDFEDFKDDCADTSFNVVGINDGSESIIKSFDYEGDSSD